MRELLLTYKHEAHITPSVSFSVIPKACETGSVAFRWTKSIWYVLAASVHPIVRSACFVLGYLFIYLDCECHTLPESTRISTVLIYECSQSLAIEERHLAGNLTGTYMMKFFHAVIVFVFFLHTLTQTVLTEVCTSETKLIHDVREQLIWGARSPDGVIVVV